MACTSTSTCTVFSVLLDPAVLPQVAKFLSLVDVQGISIIDVVVSDGRYRPVWLQLLR